MLGIIFEPFCGTCAVLLARPNWNPQEHCETVNDADGHIANVWRSLQQAPDEVARGCDWPVNHADLIARKKRLNAENESLLERLCADESYCNPLLAGYYIWAASCWIGHGLICPNQIPHLGDAGMGVHAKGKRPHLSRTGAGIHQRPHEIADNTDIRDSYNVNIYRWFRRLSERLRYVRVVCGDWKRVCGGNWQTGPGKPVGIFFDPPYSDKANKRSDLYSTDSLNVAHEVREWCRQHALDPDYRIVLAGYYEEHAKLEAEGWSVHRWSAQGGYAHIAGRGAESPGQVNRHKETLFFSPHCVNNGILFP